MIAPIDPKLTALNVEIGSKMSNQPMKGIRVLEVAQFTFTPAAGAILADWGADVIKVEHPVSGDAQRGITIGTGGASKGTFQPLMELPNRGKRSIGLALDSEDGRRILDELIAESDVFLTNFLPSARKRLRLDVEDVRSVRPDIIYARGSAHGVHGPEADVGGYDLSTFWCRGGGAWGATPGDAHTVSMMPGGAMGDSMSGMTLAGGISAALFARERTGETSVVDVSLLGVACWGNSLSIGSAVLTGEDPPRTSIEGPAHVAANPTVGHFPTSDGRFINLTMLQPGRFWADLCRHIDRPDLIEDERFNSGDKLMMNASVAGALVESAIAEKPYTHWVQQFQTLEGTWAPVQSPLEVAADEQVRANGYLVDLVDADGLAQKIVSSPVQFDEVPFDLIRAPQFAEHTDDIICELGYDTESLLRLKFDGVIT